MIKIPDYEEVEVCKVTYLGPFNGEPPIRVESFKAIKKNKRIDVEKWFMRTGRQFLISDVEATKDISLIPMDPANGMDCVTYVCYPQDVDKVVDMIFEKIVKKATDQIECCRMCIEEVQISRSKLPPSLLNSHKKPGE